MRVQMSRVVAAPPDTLPPVITLLGSGKVYRAADGSEGMIDNVLVGALFSHTLNPSINQSIFRPLGPQAGC